MRVLLVPGFTQPASSWEPVAARLRAAGLQPALLEVPDGLDFASTADALAGAGGTGVWAGYSMGGRLALRVALDHPGRVDGLLLLGASAGLADPGERAARQADDDALAAEAERDGVDAFLARWLARPLFATLPATAAGVDDRRRWATPARLAHQLRALGTGAMEPLWPRLGELAGPLTLAAGALDTKFVAVAESMAAALAPGVDVRVARVEGAGHAAHLEQPAAVADLVVELADRVRAHRPGTE